MRVHQRRVRVRRDVGRRSAPRPPAPAPTRRPPARGCCSWPRPSTTPPGLGLPIVMTVANRAIGAPINIWNDHSDAMSLRDSGWIQLFAETNQEALDLHIQAFRLAEELSLPVMVCMDGFILTHAFERVDMPDPGSRSMRSCRPYRAAPGARPATSRSRSARWSGPRPSPRSATSRTAKQLAGARADPGARRRSSRASSAATSGGLVTAYRTRGRRDDRRRARARCSGTIKDVVDELRDEGVEDRRRSASRSSGRSPCRRRARRARQGAAASSCSRRRFAVGVRRDPLDRRRMALVADRGARTYTVVAGLGGRPIPEASLRRALRRGDPGRARAP